MGVHITTRFQRNVESNGITVWEDIEAGYDDPQDYDLYAWLGDVKNRIGITPIAQMRGTPPDMKSARTSDYGYDTYDHWLLGTEILETLPLLVDLKEKGTIGNWVKRTPGRPEYYGHNTNHVEYDEKSDIVKHDTGYAVHLWREVCNFHRVDYKCSPPATSVKNGGISFKPKRKRPLVAKHLAKLRKYADRVGRYNYVKEWDFTAEEQRKQFSPLTDIVHSLVKQHGQIRVLMNFN